MRATLLLRIAGMRALTPQTLLETVRNDPGKTAPYYANRYFGVERTSEVNHLLWTNLKMFNKVELQRPRKVSDLPIWNPVLEFHRRHEVRLHDPDEEDLSILREYENGSENLSTSTSTSSSNSKPTSNEFSRTSSYENVCGKNTSLSSSPSSSHFAKANAEALNKGSDTYKNVNAEFTDAKQNAEAEALELESAIMQTVQLEPEKDIQHYISSLPIEMQLRAPSAFKRLREAGLLERIITERGTFVWK